jgi:hypothetical protein
MGSIVVMAVIIIIIIIIILEVFYKLKKELESKEVMRDTTNLAGDKAVNI